MTTILLRVLLFLLIPAGIFLLIQGIKLIQKSLGGAVLLSIPFGQSDAQFVVPKEGEYAVWQKGRNIHRVAIAMPTPFINNERTGKNVELSYPFARVSSNDGRTGKVRVFTFWAPAGQYRYGLSADTTTRDTWIGKLRSHTKTDTTDCFIEIKESRPASLLVAGILILIVSGFCIIAGLVFTLNPDIFAGS